MEKITLDLINSFQPCYDPASIGFTEDLSLTPLEFIEQFSEKVEGKEDIIWLFCRNEFMSDKDLRLFAVWCAREALKTIPTPDIRSVNACDIAERYAKGEATDKELIDAQIASYAVVSRLLEASRLAAEVAAKHTASWAAQVEAQEAGARLIAATAAESVVTRSPSKAAAWASNEAARSLSESATREAQVEKLKEYFE